MAMMQEAASKNKSVENYQLWQHDNHPIEIFTRSVLEQKMNYIHYNPVKAGWVLQPEHWRYSSAIDYSGTPGLVKLERIRE